MKRYRTGLSGALIGACMVSGTAMAQQTENTGAEETAAGDEIVVTGTRVEGRKAAEAISPVDVVSGDLLERQATFDLTDQLRNLTPSFNTQRFPIADGTAFIRPANLRNLSPDQTLVLVNGKRRHRSALVNLQVEPFGTVNQGSHAVDFGLIPAAAIERIEVLRDGASAQYGSDAIAGVINIILKKRPDGLSLTSQYGKAFAGDSEASRLSANIGMPFGDGFFNLSGELLSTDPSSRGSARPDAAAVAAFVGADRVPFGALGQRWGDPEVEGGRLFFNMETQASERVSAYGHGSYSSQSTLSSFFYRTPVGVPGVGPRGTLLVDADGDGRPDPVDQATIDQTRARGLDPADYFTADGSSPSGFVALNPIASLFPGGYTPSFGADILDYEAVLGVRGETDIGLRWDLSGRVGENEVRYVLLDSINPSLGRTSPTSFRPGTLNQFESGLNLDMVYPLAVAALASPLNIAFGGEVRRESYQIGIGDVASFQAGPGAAIFGVGSDGFQGKAPEAAGTFAQDSYAAYVDLEADLVDWISVGAALRFEDPENFDSSVDWKLSTRIQALPWLAVRGTANTAFRTPTPGQANTLDVTTTSDSSGRLVPLGTFPVNNPAAIALGSKPLQTEESKNYTVGVAITPANGLSLTADYFQIDIDNRIALANFSIAPGSPEQQALINAGVQNADLIGSVSYFTNAFDSRVEGVELGANTRMDAGALGRASFDVRHSYIKQTVRRFEPNTIDAERVFDLENQLPRNRTIVTADLRTPWRVDVLVRANHYSSWKDATFGEISSFGSAWLFDLAATVHVRDWLRVTAGAENITDKYPDNEQNGVLNFLGATRPLSSPFGFNGGSWYLKVGADF